MELFETLHSDACSICGQISENEEGVQGMFGMIPVTFCQMCLDSMVAMVQDLNMGEYEEEDMLI